MSRPPATQLKSIRDLMEEIAIFQDSRVSGEPELAERALRELLVGYGDLIWKLVHKFLGPEDEDERGTLFFDRSEIYSRLVQRIWKYATSFAPKGDDPEGFRKQFVAWVKSMLRNTVVEIHQTLAAERDQLEYLEGIWEAQFASETSESERVSMVREALEEMDPDDVEVLRWSAPLLPIDGGPMSPDPAEREALCLQLGVTPESLRQRRSRALKKLEKALRDKIEL